MNKLETIIGWDSILYIAIGFSDPVLESDGGEKNHCWLQCRRGLLKGIVSRDNKHFVPLVFKLVGSQVEEKINVKILLPSKWKPLLIKELLRMPHHNFCTGFLSRPLAPQWRDWFWISHLPAILYSYYTFSTVD